MTTRNPTDTTSAPDRTRSTGGALQRSALLANAAFSLATGTLLAFAAPSVGSWLAVDIDPWLRTLGVLLVGHGGALLWAQRHTDSSLWAKLNLALIAPYPLAMLALLVFGIVERPLGQLLIALDGVVVGVIAGALWRSIRHSAADLAPGRSR